MYKFTGFIDSKPLNRLNNSVLSDHASVRISLDDSLFIASYNISNKQYHYYFGPDGPYAQTHLYVHNNSSKEEKEWLNTKHNIQINYIIKELLSNEIHIYVIQEAHLDFIKTIRKLLPSHFIFTHREINDEFFTGNITLTISNSLYIDLQNNYNQKINYHEINNPIERHLYIPTISFKHNNKNINLYNVHIGGNNEQFPKNGILTLLKMMENNNSCYNIACGDFNTTTNNIKSLLHENSFIDVMDPLYPTHINPYCQIVSYDNVIYSKQLNVKQLSLSQCDDSTFYLVDALLNNIN